VCASDKFLLVFALLATVACHKEQSVSQAAVQTVRAGTVDRIQPDTAERYSATISPFTQVDLAFKSAGLIERILEVRGADGRMRNVEPGDHVAKGAELVLVRTVDYEQRVQQAETQVAQAEAQLAQVQANFQQAEIDYQRDKNLYEAASLVKPEYDQAKARYDSTQASVNAAKASIASAQSVVDQAKLSLSDTSLRAPFSGWITARNVEAGSLVGNATVGFSLMDTHLVKAVFAVSDTSLRTVRLGQKQTVLLDAIERQLRGTVTSIAPQADPKSRVFSVEVTIENPKEDVRPGMIGTLTLGPQGSSITRLVVPLDAVVQAPDNPKGFAVFRLTTRDERTYATAQSIQAGNTYGNSIEVVSGLTAGQRIVTLGGSLLRDGQEVRVLP
jgi:RND family efflux transporter MFP subunit